MGLTLETRLAASFSSRLHACVQALGCDFAMLDGNVGIGSWAWNDAVKRILSMPCRLKVSSDSWMMPVAMIGMTKIPEGQGEWAGKAALRILAGTAPDEISPVANRKWDLYLECQTDRNRRSATNGATR